MSAYISGDQRYVVMSYGTIIARLNMDPSESSLQEVIRNEQHYSKTTSRHQKLCKEYL